MLTLGAEGGRQHLLLMASADDESVAPDNAAVVFTFVYSPRRLRVSLKSELLHLKQL